MCCNWIIDRNGLVSGHAYSILKVVNINGIKLLQFRNPWGRSGEYNGDWSDKSDKWNQNPHIKSTLCFNGEKDDGIFWMEYKDFMLNVKAMGICNRSVNIYTDINMRIENENTYCGPTISCFKGIFS